MHIQYFKHLWGERDPAIKCLLNTALFSQEMRAFVTELYMGHKACNSELEMQN